MRSLSIVALVLLALVLFAAGAAEAHRQGLRSGYTRLAYDCSHDYGWESGHPEDLGHELVTLDATERDEAGRSLLIFELNFVQAMSVVGQRPGYEIKETLSFAGPRGTYSTTLRTSDEETFTLLAGEPPAYIGPRKAGLTGTDWNATAADESLIAIDVGYTYEQLKIQNGEHVRDAKLVGHYESLGAWRQGDILPGGTTAPSGAHEPACLNGHHSPESDETWYVAPAFEIARSDWYLVPPPNRPPTAAFSYAPANPNANESIAFTDASTDPDANLASWSWDFGDGVTSPQRSPSHSFSRPGNFTVRLTVQDAEGLASSMAQTIRVVRPPSENLPPVVNFTWLPATPAAGQNVTFQDHSVDPDGTIVSREWNVGYWNKVSGEVYTRAFGPGRHNITLFVVDSDGAARNLTKTLEIPNRPPRANGTVSHTTVLAGQPVWFLDKSADDGHVVNISWSDIEGRVAYGKMVDWTFPSPGNWTIRHVVLDDLGVANERSFIVTVHADTEVVLPSAAFHADRSVANISEPIRFTRQESARWERSEWDFGDGNTSVGDSVEHAYHKAGDYTVTFHVSNISGRAWNHSLLRISIVDRPPHGDFASEPASPVAGEPVRFIDRALDPDGGSLTTAWIFGDGATSSDPSPVHLFPASGSYEVVRRATDEGGNVLESRVRVIVRAPPNHAPLVDFAIGSETLTVGRPVDLASRAFDPDGFVRRWEWIVGGEVVGNEPQLVLRPSSSGPLLIELRVWDDAGASAEAAKRVVVHSPLLEPRIVVTPGQGLETVVLSTEAEAEIVAWEWHFGDGSVARSATVVRDASRAEVVRVVVTDRDGQVATTELALGDGAALESASVKAVPIGGATIAAAAVLLAVACRKRWR